MSLPQSIGPFVIERRIGGGGMGTVYAACQEAPRRTVALKVMNLSMTGQSDRRRFEYEAQILAHLRHPGIAQVYGAGVHRDGGSALPYYVMEYVPDARSVTEFARMNRLDIHQRLELFLGVCDAVNHGHQKGVIHRDLKPANILVEPSGQSKIIDFGIARVIESDLAITRQTQAGQLMGTLQYMSPEQVCGDPDRIDIRTDVYSLGVVLYELVCQTLPYNLSGKNLYECADAVRNAEPPKPSSANPLVPDDLDTIILKALEKDADRRYQSAAELAGDIRRCEANEPILARAPSAMYQFRTFVRRNRALVGGVILIGATLTIATIVSTQFALRSNRSERLASSQANRLAAVNQFFLEDLLGSANPRVSLGEEPTVRHVLDAKALELDSIADPVVRSEIETKIGEMYVQLSHFQLAEEHLRTALHMRRSINANPLDVAETAHQLAVCLLNRNRFAEAKPLFEEAIELQQAVAPDEQIRSIPTTLDLGTLQMLAGDLDSAASTVQGALATARHLPNPDQVAIAEGMILLGDIEFRRNDRPVAEKHYRDALDILKAALPEHHPIRAAAANHLGTLLCRGDQWEEGLALLEVALRNRERVLPPDHTELAQGYAALGDALLVRDRWADALPYLERSVAIYVHALGDRPHKYPAKALVLMGQSLFGLQRYEEALASFEEAIAIYTRLGDSEAHAASNARMWSGACLILLGKAEDASRTLDAELTALEDTKHLSRRDQFAVEAIVQAYESTGKAAQAKQWQDMLHARADVGD